MSESSDDPFAELEDSDVSDADVEDLFEEMDGSDLGDESDVDDFFEHVEAPEVDEEAVFEAVFDDESDTDGPSDGSETEAVVSKEQYCKKCEYFSEPPEVACNNPGTEIVELVGIDSFRLRNCPVVVERGRAKRVFPDKK